MIVNEIIDPALEEDKGRGFLQITGRWNYSAASEALGLPLVQNPTLANNPDVAAKVSIWYWNTFVKPKVTDFTDVEAVTKRINSGLRGLEDRQENFQELMKVAMQ